MFSCPCYVKVAGAYFLLEMKIDYEALNEQMKKGKSLIEQIAEYEKIYEEAWVNIQIMLAKENDKRSKENQPDT